MISIKKFIRKENFDHVYLVEPWNICTKDTMENLYIADLLISDNSSIAYQSLIFQIPILIVDTEKNNIVDKQDRYDLRAVVDRWNGHEAIKPLVDENIKTNKYKDDLKTLLKNCFYFNDGKSTERAVKFLSGLDFR
jgi:CDP-glycerol glycerophosphotransferase (TagB/SpsB family)